MTHSRDSQEHVQAYPEQESSGQESPAHENPTNENPTNGIEKRNQTELLLKHPKLWRAGEIAVQQSQSRSGTSTGFAQLDDLLPDAGWPAASLMELLLPSAGIGELRLLMSAIKALSQSQPRWIAWINPPFIPYAPALKDLGVDINKMLLIHPRSHADALWALERATRSGSCSLAMAWLDEQQIKLKDTQRLQVAARQGETLTCLFRPLVSDSIDASMAELRLALKSLDNGELTLDLIKRRGGWPLRDLVLPLAEVTQTTRIKDQEIREQLELWRDHKASMPGTEPEKDMAGELSALQHLGSFAADHMLSQAVLH